MISLFSNIAVDIKIHVTAPLSGAAAEEDRRRPPVPPPEMPAFRKTGVAMMRPPLLQETAAMAVERQQSEMASTHLTKFATKFRKRSNTR